MARLRLAAPVLVAAALIPCAGCGGGGQDAGGPGTPADRAVARGEPDGATAETGPATGAGGARLVVGAILMQQDQFFRLNERGMDEAAARLGAELKVQNAAGALDREAALVETFVTQRVGAILISPLSSAGSVPALRRAHDRGIRIITYNNGLGAAFPAADIQSDQGSLGEMSGRAARAHIESRLGGRARIALIGFASQLPEQGGARVRGFRRALEGLAGAEIVAEQDAWNAPEAATTVAALLAKSPDIVWAANEGGTVGAVTAVRNAGRAGKVAVFGTDVSVQLLDFLLDDDGILQAVTAQKPFEMGQEALEAAVEALRNPGAPPRKVVLEGVLFSRDRPDEARAYRRSLAEDRP